jgi:hypothetical protein
MMQSYTVTEVEDICGISRRTISEYVAKGLLSGPSHRGRGARYPQSDIDVLKLLPKFRTLMKREFPNLNAVATFVRQISMHDLRMLAKKSSAASFVLAVKRLRIRNSLAALAPHVAPEHIENVLDGLSEGQIRAIDSGRYQIGAVLDISALLQEHPKLSAQAVVNGNSHPDMTAEINTEASWSASWLDGGQSASVNTNHNGFDSEDVDELTAMLSRIEHKAASTNAELRDQPAPSAKQYGRNLDSAQRELPMTPGRGAEYLTSTDATLGERLNDIAQRLERLEAILE